MRFSAIITVLVSGASALTMAVAPRQNNGCFDMAKGTCLGRQADFNNATNAVINACNKVTSCTPGQTGHGRPRVTGTFSTLHQFETAIVIGCDLSRVLTIMCVGIVKGFPYTATLYVGDNCGGVVNWSTPACVELFNQFVDVRCEALWPSGDGLFQRKFHDPTCDT